MATLPSSGKTYTMQGSGNTGGEGIIHMAAKDIFSHVAKSQNITFSVSTKFLEIYNNGAFDLLKKREKCKVHESPSGGFYATSTTQTVKDCTSLLTLLAQGEKLRMVAETSMNKVSSCSHCIIQIDVQQNN